MICNLCGMPAEMRRHGGYVSHMNADGDSCPAAGMHPDEALDRRRTFGTMRRLLRLIDGADGIGVHARMVRDDITAQMWVTLTPADARRMAAELIEIADLQDGRG